MNDSPDYNQEFFARLQQGNRRALARAISMIESRHPKIKAQARALMIALGQTNSVAEHSLKIGITGPPGVGKSTFIEGFGQNALKRGMRLCVLPIDPTSPLSGGSLLGDRTRMENLSKSENCFIRPSPSGQQSGGVSWATRDVLRLCELVGFDLILVETVGVGQGETDVCSMVDSSILIYPPQGGDELQGLKKGILEVADFFFINKADILPEAASKMQMDLRSAFSVLPTFRHKNLDFVFVGSAIDLERLDLFQDLVFDHLKAGLTSGNFQSRRKQNSLVAFQEGIKERVITRALSNKSLKSKIRKLEKKIQSGEISVLEALDTLLPLKA